jgi:hypothetical protein
MTINLQARTDFTKGDYGRIVGHIVSRIDTPKPGERVAIALSEVRAGENAWFEIAAA